jgi:hypothetical protein
MICLARCLTDGTVEINFRKNERRFSSPPHPEQHSAFTLKDIRGSFTGDRAAGVRKDRYIIEIYFIAYFPYSEKIKVGS